MRRAEGDVPRRLHGGGARRRSQPRVVDGADGRAPTRRRSSKKTQGAHDRSHRLRGQARRRSTARRFDRALAFGQGRASRVAATRRAATSSSSRRRAPARAAAPACPSSTRAGSRSTPSRGGARTARAPASRAARRRSPEERPTTPCDACDGSRLAPLPRARAPRRRALPRGHRALGRRRAARWAKTLALRRRPRRASPTRRSRELLRRLDVRARGRPRLPRPRPRAPRRSPAARCSASASPRSSAAASPARSTCSTSRPSACTRATPGACSATCASSPTWARTVLVVEHDAETIRAADHLIDLGPGGGRGGGHVVAEGPPRRRARRPALAHRRARSPDEPRRVARACRGRRPTRGIELTGARAHNLHDVDASASRSAAWRRRRRQRLGQEHARAAGPLPGAAPRARPRRAASPARTTRITVHEGASRARSPSTSRPSAARRASVPATFLGVWDEVRKLFAVARPRRKVRGYGAGALLVQQRGRRRPLPGLRRQGRHRRTRCRSCPT